MPNAPPFVTDGQPRRICDYIASAPWAVTPAFKPGYYPRDKGPARIRESNLDAAAALLQRRTTVVFADEVASSLSSRSPTAEEVFRESPGVMPPFRDLLIDARTGGLEAGYDFTSLAVRGYTLDLAEPRMDLALADPSTRRNWETFFNSVHPRRRPSVRASVHCDIWCQRHDHSIIGPIAHIYFFLDHDFRMMHVIDRDDFDDGNPLTTTDDAVGKPIMGIRPLVMLDAYKNTPLLLFEFYLLALAVFVRTCSLMNASNVKYIPSGTTNSTASIARTTRDRLSKISYHVLRLKVGTRLVPIEPHLPSGPRHSPLTIVRGHFKDFSTSGLFGKYKGQKYSHIWCPSFVRGTASDGVVARDYTQSTEPVANCSCSACGRPGHGSDDAACPKNQVPA